MVIATGLLAAQQSDRLVYRCVSVADQSVFVLSFDRRGSRLSEVVITHGETPRLGRDWATRWRGEMLGSEAVFRFQDRGQEVFSAEMTLRRDPEERAAYQLAWTSQSGGGHLIFEGEGSARCSRSPHVTADLPQ